ncbi:murein hydrolase activator EnvC family protein [Robertkochia aurantiaca]|uniref:murein hydrolase activator EnvC family protein n=1 Tax=Robertkochia aurantiaca TaxID=2873700 RepID=UPI001CCA11B2|nr:peptidoglycan DD-metalloendopeptidase family protein [Robertkochia sp. 3YJGBD-33]
MFTTRALNIIVLFFCCCNLTLTYGQSDEKQELEAKKNRLEQEIRQINKLLSQQQKKRSNILEELEDLDQKVRVRRELIKVTNQQANLITREINTNQNRISDLREELQELKDDYAAMINKSYRSKSQQSRLMFILSSEDFFQAYKRLKYMQQYAAYRKEQGEQIKEITEELQRLNKNLIAQRQEKETLIAENREIQRTLERELGMQKELINSIRKQEDVYAAQIKKKQREADAIDRQIEKLVREAIARSNKREGNEAKSSNFSLTEEARLVDKDFRANKGKLPWPVEKGVLKMRFGTQPHPVVRSVTIRSNGVRIATEAGASARSIFDGKVLAVQAIKGGNKAVLIQHGNYISVYNNLGKVYVKEGDNVATKQEIGQVFTSTTTNETLLKFMIYENNKIDNPANWIYRM